MGTTANIDGLHFANIGKARLLKTIDHIKQFYLAFYSVVCSIGNKLYLCNIRFLKSKIMHFSKLFNYCPSCGSSSFATNSEKSCRCQSCGFVYYINASAAVAVFIFNEKGQLLVCERGKEPAKGSWDLPGGFVDEDESAEQAVIREINEELGVDISACRYLFSFPNRYEYSGLTIPTLDLFFACTVYDITQIKADDDVAACHFVSLNEINTDMFGFESIRNGVIKFISSQM